MRKMIRTSSLVTAYLLSTCAASAFAQQSSVTPESREATTGNVEAMGTAGETPRGADDTVDANQDTWAFRGPGGGGGHGGGGGGHGGPGGGGHGPGGGGGGGGRGGPGPGHGPGGGGFPGGGHGPGHGPGGGGWHPGPGHWPGGGRPGPGPGHWPGGGYPYPYPVPGPGGYYQCSAQDGYGQIFYATAYDAGSAQQFALQQCFQSSNFNCFSTGCVFQ